LLLGKVENSSHWEISRSGNWNINKPQRRQSHILATNCLLHKTTPISLHPKMLTGTFSTWSLYQSRGWRTSSFYNNHSAHSR
jgi:hypothetical protein